jgi:hypothetical protein
MQLILPELRKVPGKESKRVFSAWLRAAFWKEDPWYGHWEVWLSYLFIMAWLGISIKLGMLLLAALPGLPGWIIIYTGGPVLSVVMAVITARLMYRPYRARVADLVNRETVDNKKH